MISLPEKLNLLQTVSDISEYANFMVLEGELFIDLENEQTISLLPGEIFKVPAFTQHRTRSTIRTVNLCFETKEKDIKGNS
ncbi:hypothetical protein [Paenisporosarcina sp. TG-14]|uniref:hypothetical protein n=1 Tax=Paenisporosarcina sp. TG-14 TaxID=1231057 RepID=UPI0002F96FE2|nr:hypothetical protein [Paenisporosarcina sp. TG-14]